MNRHLLSNFFASSLLTLACAWISLPASAEDAGAVSVAAFGAKADGVTDDTATIQQALDQAAKAGGRVNLSPARYLVRGSLHIPPGVTLQGVMDSPVWSEPLKGSIILATGGRDNENAPALFELGHSSAVRGLTVFYPEQQTTNIHAYPLVIISNTCCPNRLLPSFGPNKRSSRSRSRRPFRRSSPSCQIQ